MAGVEVSGVLVNNSGPFLTHYAFEGAGENSLTRVSAYFNLTQHATKVEFKGESLTELNVVGQKELDQSPFMVALKVISYCTVIIPLIMLIIYAIVRSHYTVISQSSSTTGTSTPGGHATRSPVLAAGSSSKGSSFSKSQASATSNSVKSTSNGRRGNAKPTSSRGLSIKPSSPSQPQPIPVVVKPTPKPLFFREYDAFLKHHGIDHSHLYKDLFKEKREGFADRLQGIDIDKRRNFIDGYDKLSDIFGFMMDRWKLQRRWRAKFDLNNSPEAKSLNQLYGPKKDVDLSKEEMRCNRKILQIRARFDDDERVFNTLIDKSFLETIRDLGVIQGFVITAGKPSDLDQVEIIC